MSANTDPAGFDPEATGAFRVDTLSNSGAALRAETFLARAEEEAERTAPVVVPPLSEYRYRGPALEYHHSDGLGTVTRIDHAAPGQSFATPEDRIRELMIARALLRHALHLVDKELNGL